MRALAASLLVLTAGSSAIAQTPTLWIWNEEAELTPNDAVVSDFCGGSVSLDGPVALLGAHLQDSGFPNSGSVYVFMQSGSAWTQLAKLTASDPGADALFGCSVAVSGNTALVGALGDDAAGDRSGAAYVFVRQGWGWFQQAKLVASDAEADDQFGCSVALDGNTALIGAKSDGGINKYFGSAYVFVRSGSSWSEEARLTPSNPANLDWFGGAVSLDGDTALIGAFRATGGAYTSGSAFVFVGSGSSWTEQAELLAGDAEQYDGFGYSVSVDGDTALVGAPESDDAGLYTGSAYVFRRSGTTWAQEEKLLASDLAALEYFGSSVALSEDTALVGAATYSGGNDPGAAYAFARAGSSWSEEEMLLPGNLAPSDWFGSAMCLFENTALIGSPQRNGVGAAYIFTRPPVAGTGFCFGDPGSGTPCPCSNDNDGSVPGSGCDNGAFSSGAHLIGRGTASVTHDTIVLQTEYLEPTNSGLYFQADNRVNGGAGTLFGDGLRCAGGALVRLQVVFADAEGRAETSIAIAAQGGVAAGETKRYQHWYRTTHNPPCGLWVNDFNLSNGFEITWGP